MKNEFWSTANFKRLKNALWQLYWDDFLIPTHRGKGFSASASARSDFKHEDIAAGSLAFANWKKYKEKNNIKPSKPKVRIEAIYYPNSISVTADEYRSVEEEYYNSQDDVVVIQNPLYASLCTLRGVSNKYAANEFFNPNSTWAENATSTDLNEKYIEIPEKFARQILVLKSFKIKI